MPINENELEVFIGYESEKNEYQGFIGRLDIAQYELLKKLAEKCSRPDVLSIDKLEALSDAKDLLAQVYIKLYDYKEGLSEDEGRKVENVVKAMGEALESFDIYRDDAPQLDFLLSLFIMDASESDPDRDYESGKFQELDEDEEKLKVETPRKGKKAHSKEWIKYLASVKTIPVWDESLQPFPVYFRRLIKPEEARSHLEGFGKKTRKRVAEILGIKNRKDCKRVRREIEKRFPQAGLEERIKAGDIKYIAVSEDFVDVIHEWFELGGRRQMAEQTMSEGEIEWIAEVDIKIEDTAIATEIEWWRDNINYFETETEYELTTMLFRAMRNNILKCARTGKLVISSPDWEKRIEIL